MHLRIPASVPPTTGAPVPPAERDAPLPPVPPSGPAVEADKWLRRFRAVLAGVLGAVVAGIGALAFYTSFEAIRAYAQRSGGIPPAHAWAIPLLVDSFIVVATGADLWFTTTKQQRRLWEVWWPKALLVGSAAVSFVLNVAHAQAGDWPARGVAAIPPAALVLGVELLMMVLRRATTIRAAQLEAAVPAPVPPAPPAPARPGPARQSRRAPARGGRSQSDKIRDFVLAERAEGRSPSAAEAARRFGADPSLGRRIVRELAASNGHATSGGTA
jgi:hypothetical protein